MLLAFALQVDIAGSLYYWGLSINTITTVLLVLVVGLSVDYAVHVAHAFMRATGSRKGEAVIGLSCPYILISDNLKLWLLYHYIVLCRKSMCYIV